MYRTLFLLTSVESASSALASGTLLLFCLNPNAAAQRAGIDSPGAPAGGGLGQSTRFDNEFNPAISLSATLLFDWARFDGPSPDGLDASLRRVDLLIADWIDPNAFAWTTIAYEDEELVLDEAAIEYVALPGNFTLRGGRFFVDFGKQMQAHVEELRTIERPLVLREFLGEELPADGLQLDDWFSAGDVTIVRYSLGVFADVSGEAEEGEGPTIHVADRKDAEDMGFTARLTALTEVGENGTLQFGTSARILPDFTFEEETSGLDVAGQGNVVYGLDFTYGWASNDGIRRFTVGGEYLRFDGDLSSELDDNGTPGNAADDFLSVFDDRVNGFYAFADHGWSQFDSAGVQYSLIEQPQVDKAHIGELDLYYTRQLSEYLRLRVGLTLEEVEHGEDSVRLAIQLTGFIGPHGHGLNW